MKRPGLKLYDNPFKSHPNLMQHCSNRLTSCSRYIQPNHHQFSTIPSLNLNYQLSCTIQTNLANQLRYHLNLSPSLTIYPKTVQQFNLMENQATS